VKSYHKQEVIAVWGLARAFNSHFGRNRALDLREVLVGLGTQTDEPRHVGLRVCLSLGPQLESPQQGKPQATASKQLSPLLRSVLILRFGAG
jgi:hypothetical protein